VTEEILFLNSESEHTDESTGSVVRFLQDYECSRCGCLLSAEGRPKDCWLRCPECGRPSAPLEAGVAVRPVWRNGQVNSAVSIGHELPPPSLGERLAALPYPAVLGLAFCFSLLVCFAVRLFLNLSGPQYSLSVLLMFVALAFLFRPRRDLTDAD
jgi:hypothetical protein